MVTKAQAEKVAEQVSDAPMAPPIDRLMAFQEPEYKSVAVLMGEVLAELPAIGKDSKMTAGGSYNYRSIEDILPVLNGLLSAKGLVPVLNEVYSVAETLRPTRNGGVMYSTRLQARWAWTGPLGDTIMAGGAGEAADNGDKGTQKALTSAYKYMLVQTFAISTTESNAADVDHYANEEHVLTPQQERRRAFEAAGGTVPEGWSSFEDFDTAHETVKLGIKGMPEDQQATLKAYRAEAGLPWPMTAAQMDQFCEKVVEVREASIEFEGAPEGGSLEEAKPEAEQDK